MTARYATEGALCDAFAEAASAAGWTVYAECDGWDLVLTRDDRQWGVEAKLRCSLEVVAQVLQRMRRSRTPHHAAVLVPCATAAMAAVCEALRIEVVEHPRFTGRWHVAPKWEHVPVQLLHLPPVPLVGGGRPSPRVMSRWRVKALRLVLLARDRGYLTGADFAAAGVERSRWVRAGWLIRDGMEGRRARYVLGDGAHRPDVGYEVEMAALATLNRDA